MSEVHRMMQARGVFASIDMHNNTGINPHYCVVNRLDQAVLHLACCFPAPSSGFAAWRARRRRRFRHFALR
ncbi:MAG: hypothetical protein V5B38_04155 [Candidatus Accumulibacter propinquus]